MFHEPTFHHINGSPGHCFVLCIGDIKLIPHFISWYNLITSSSDIMIQFLMRQMKPSKSMFYRGHQRASCSSRGRLSVIGAKERVYGVQ